MVKLRSGMSINQYKPIAPKRFAVKISPAYKHTANDGTSSISAAASFPTRTWSTSLQATS